MASHAVTHRALSARRRTMGDGRLPKTAHESLNADRITEPMAPKYALSGAVRLANQLKIALVAQGPDGVWKPEWGELYRDESE